ncbi:MAG TPA: hypothetical protein VF142_10625 [Longimicrobium sp.]
MSSLDEPARQVQMIRPILLASLALLAACGAADADDSPAPRADSASIAAVQSAAGDTLIRPAAPRYPYTLLDSATADVDGDGAPERVELAATVELGGDGQPLWDDGHQWMVAVRDGADTYPLVERFVPWGGAAFWIVAEDGARSAAILVQTSALSSGGGTMRVEKFVFDPGRRGYARTGVVGASGHPAVYRGPPPGIGILPPTPR